MPPVGNNHVAEWYGHRIYPVVADTATALSDQRSQSCPFLSDATGTQLKCVKLANSSGVCTVSSMSNSRRQDWLACPFRALDRALLEDAARRLFGHPTATSIDIVAAPVLADPRERATFLDRVRRGKPAIAYFQNKLGGEISLSATARSPEMSFDATMVEVLETQTGPTLGRYGVFEIQTMDFHGTYRKAVGNLHNALELHGNDFPSQVARHPEWASDGMEGPNIANVFKRTFYQMMFKFQIGDHPSSAGCIFAIPRAVWDSWQRHLGAPDLIESADGTWRLGVSADGLPDPSAWIYVFDLTESEDQSPNAIELWRVIGTDSASLSHYALTVAPDAALSEGGAVDNIALSIRTRLKHYLPELL